MSKIYIKITFGHCYNEIFCRSNAVLDTHPTMSEHTKHVAEICKCKAKES